MASTSDPLAGLDPSMPEYWVVARRPPEPEWPDLDPAPEVTNRDPVPADAPRRPGPVLSLMVLLQEYGWIARAGFSRGYVRTQKTGVFKRVDVWGVWTNAHPDTGWRVSAMYEREIKEDAKWSWSSIHIWSVIGQCPLGDAGGSGFTHASITDLKEFASRAGKVGTTWFSHVASRVEAQKKAQKEAAKNRPKRVRNV